MLRQENYKRNIIASLGPLILYVASAIPSSPCLGLPLSNYALLTSFPPILRRPLRPAVFGTFSTRALCLKCSISGMPPVPSRPDREIISWTTRTGAARPPRAIRPSPYQLVHLLSHVTQARLPTRPQSRWIYCRLSRTKLLCAFISSFIPIFYWLYITSHIPFLSCVGSVIFTLLAAPVPLQLANILITSFLWVLSSTLSLMPQLTTRDTEEWSKAGLNKRREYMPAPPLRYACI